MDDLSEKLAEILSDPASMNKVKQMAESLLGEQVITESPPQPPTVSGIADMLNGAELRSVMSIITRLKTTKDDSRVQLLNALKPHLSDPRRERVDTAIKLLKLFELWPLIKESGIIKF